MKCKAHMALSIGSVSLRANTWYTKVPGQSTPSHQCHPHQPQHHTPCQGTANPCSDTRQRRSRHDLQGQFIRYPGPNKPLNAFRPWARNKFTIIHAVKVYLTVYYRKKKNNIQIVFFRCYLNGLSMKMFYKCQLTQNIWATSTVLTV
jgi:hypothetical protein